MTIQEKIKTIDWTNHNGCNKYYNSEKCQKSLLELILLNKESKITNTYDNVLFSIGNNHAGTYYPVILDALDIIIEVARNAQNEIARNCALEIISDLSFSFEPDAENYKSISTEELYEFVQNQISCFIWNYDFEFESDRNQKLLNDLKEYFQKRK